MKLLLIRHGQSVANVEGRVQGWLDSPLCDLGRGQAQALASRLVREAWPIRALYSSDLLRAAETAGILGDALGVPVVLDRRLREYDVGILTGLIWREVEFMYPEIWRQFHSADWAHIPEEEGMPRFYERVSAALADILVDHGQATQEDALAIVAHGGTLRMVLANLLHLDRTRRVPLRFENGSLTIVDLGSAPTLVRHNDVCHLSE